MKDQLISFETAKLAKEKGFNIPIQHTVNGLNQLYDIDNNEITLVTNVIDNWNKFDTVCSAPTQSLLQKWLREVHNISLFINCVGVGKNVYYYGVYYINNGEEDYVEQEGQFNYEEALEKGLQEALKLIP